MGVYMSVVEGVAKICRSLWGLGALFIPKKSLGSPKYDYASVDENKLTRTEAGKILVLTPRILPVQCVALPARAILALLI